MPLIEPRFRLIFAALFGVFMVFGTSMTIIGAALPKILTSFDWSYFVAGLVLAANSVAYFTFTFVGGYLVKHFGPKRTMLAGLVIGAMGICLHAAVRILFGPEGEDRDVASGRTGARRRSG